MGERLIEELDPEGMWWHKAQRSRAALQWAAAAVQSRAHASRNGTALVPLADAFNHSCSPNAEVFEGTTTFQVRALRIIDPGEELTISYGHFSNSELLFNAGFVLDVNPDDCILVLGVSFWRQRIEGGLTKEKSLQLISPSVAKRLARACHHPGFERYYLCLVAQYRQEQ